MFEKTKKRAPRATNKSTIKRLKIREITKKIINAFLIMPILLLLILKKFFNILYINK
jgi:hypothetical protein